MPFSKLSQNLTQTLARYKLTKPLWFTVTIMVAKVWVIFSTPIATEFKKKVDKWGNIVRDY